MESSDFSNKIKGRLLRDELIPQIHESFKSFSNNVFTDGAITYKNKQLIAVAVAHVTQCQTCIEVHTKLALKQGASIEEIMEAIWVAVEMRAGASLSHAKKAINTMKDTLNDED